MAGNGRLGFFLHLILISTIGGGCFSSSSSQICSSSQGSCNPDAFDSGLMDAQLKILQNLQLHEGCRHFDYYGGSPDHQVHVSSDIYSYCAMDFGTTECLNCLGEAVRAVLDGCSNKIGAQYALEGCCIRYETSYTFC
ncbi:unnamed protein product [Linum trigynum]|uniref:Gnk2-homologous domain-containing protein n=1 Tax=Linum trigynum TaxID=586398 RepID=A0AAV2E1F4_9ROSI